MQETTNIHIEIVHRFFAAIHKLIDKGLLKNNVTFCRELNIDPSNFVKQEKDPSRNIITLVWIRHLIVNYNVSPMWIFNGEGSILISEK